MIHELFKEAQKAHTKRPEIVRQILVAGSLQYHFKYFGFDRMVACQHGEQRGKLIETFTTSIKSDDINDVIKNLKAV